MPFATVTTTGSSPVISAASLADATAIVLQNNNTDVDIFVRFGAAVSVDNAETQGIKLPRGGGGYTVSSTLGNGGAPKLPVYAVHNGDSEDQKPLTWDKFNV